MSLGRERSRTISTTLLNPAATRVPTIASMPSGTGAKAAPPPARSYVHFASCFPTVIYNVFMHNNTLWSNSNAFSLIICKVCTEKENTSSWNSGPEKAMLEIPSELKFYKELFFGIYNKYWRKELPEVGCQVPTRHQGTPAPPGAPWWVVGSPAHLCCPSSGI